MRSQLYFVQIPHKKIKLSELCSLMNYKLVRTSMEKKFGLHTTKPNGYTPINVTIFTT
jgi:hypothetical protein